MDTPPTLIQEMIDNIQQQYAEPLRLSDYATSASYSLPWLSHHFKSKTGYTFHQYVQYVRIDEACRLLSNTEKRYRKSQSWSVIMTLTFSISFSAKEPD